MTGNYLLVPFFKYHQNMEDQRSTSNESAPLRERPNRSNMLHCSSAATSQYLSLSRPASFFSHAQVYFAVLGSWKPAKAGNLSAERILLIVPALVFQIWCSIGRRWSSISKAGQDVTLNTPPLILPAFAWSVLSKSIVYFVYPTPCSWATDHTEQPYIIWRMITNW
jgi:hypothetical protein